MSPTSWTESLQQTIRQLQASDKTHDVRIAVVGVGHELRGDDAAGSAVARQLQPLAHAQWLVVDGGHAPENHTGQLRRFAPDLVLLVDCAMLSAPAGTIRWLPWQATSGLSATTHTLPLYMLARYLTAEFNCEVALIGIQPQDTTLGAPLSPPVAEAVQAIVVTLAQLAAERFGADNRVC